MAFELMPLPYDPETLEPAVVIGRRVGREDREGSGGRPASGL